MNTLSIGHVAIPNVIRNTLRKVHLAVAGVYVTLYAISDLTSGTVRYDIWVKEDSGTRLDSYGPFTDLAEASRVFLNELGRETEEHK